MGNGYGRYSEVSKLWPFCVGISCLTGTFLIAQPAMLMPFGFMVLGTLALGIISARLIVFATTREKFSWRAVVPDWKDMGDGQRWFLLALLVLSVAVVLITLRVLIKSIFNAQEMVDGEMRFEVVMALIAMMLIYDLSTLKVYK